MLPFGLADTISSTLDFPTFGQTVWITGREMIGNLLLGAYGLCNFIGAVLTLCLSLPSLFLVIGKF